MTPNNPPPAAPEVQLACLDDLAALVVTGPDATSFLQGQTTCDINQLAPDRFSLGAVCNAKGRVLAIIRATTTDTGYVLLTERSMRDVLETRLRRYVLRAAVRIEPWSGDILGMIGDIHRVAVVPDPRSAGLTSEPNSAPEPRFLAIEAPDRAIVMVPGLRSPERADPAGLIEGSAWVGADRFKLRDIVDGIPTVTQEIAEEFVPQMLNLDLLGGISFSKGCYTGQEIVARTHYLGTVKRRMHRFRIVGGVAPRPGSRLFRPDGTIAGQIVKAAQAESQRYEALAVVTIDLEDAVDLHIDGDSGAAVERMPLAYLDTPESA